MRPLNFGLGRAWARESLGSGALGLGSTWARESLASDKLGLERVWAREHLGLGEFGLRRAFEFIAHLMILKMLPNTKYLACDGNQVYD